LAPDKRSERVEILLGLLPLKNIFGAEILDLNTKIKQENESVQKIKERKGEEIERGQRKIICFHELLEQTKISGGLIPFYKILEAVQKIKDNWTKRRSKMLWLDELIKQAKVSGELIPLNKTPEAIQEIKDK
jgi:arginine utilization protein RocB